MSDDAHVTAAVTAALFDARASDVQLRDDLRHAHITGARRVDVGDGRVAVVIHVPCRLLASFRQAHTRLVPALEKKLGGQDVVIVADRRTVPPSGRGSRSASKRPRTRSLTAVHAAILTDLVYPSEVVGKRTIFRVDGSVVHKVFLDPRNRASSESKLDVFAAVYKVLTAGKVVHFTAEC